MGKEEDMKKFDKMVEKASKSSNGEIYCPECGSSRLYYYLGGKTGQIYVCKNCNYQGPLIVEDGELAKSLKEKWKEREIEK